MARSLRKEKGHFCCYFWSVSYSRYNAALDPFHIVYVAWWLSCGDLVGLVRLVF